MKKILLLCLTLLAIASIKAQFISQVIYQRSYTKPQIDSILTSQGVPAGIFTTTYGVRTYKLIYHTVAADSSPTTASGLLIVPQGAPCKIPILSYQHNEITRKSDAPSRYKQEWYVGLAAASIGFISVLPDYLGLGDGQGLHPFLHLQSQATATIDMIRAAKEIVDTTGAQPNSQLFLGGYSEGGYATMAAHQYIQTYLGGQLHVTASAAIAGYYDMSGTMVQQIISDSIYTQPYYLPYLLFGYNSVYHYYTADSDMLVYPYDSTLHPLFNGTKSISTINAQMPNVPKHIMHQDQIDSIKNDSTNFLRVLLKKNDAYNWSPTSPLHLFFCNADEQVPYQNTVAAYQHFVQNGSTMVDTINAGPSYTHYLCAEFSVLIAIQLFTGLRSQPITSTIHISNDTSATNPCGSAIVLPSLGMPPYTVHWSNGDTTTTTSHLSAGTYYVTITDQSLCTHTDSAIVHTVTANGINDYNLDHIRSYPNPTNGMVIIENNNTDEKLEQIELLDINGKALNTYMVYEGNTTKLYFDEEAKGVYLLHVKAQSGKELHRKIVLL